MGAQKLLGGLTMSETDLMSHRKALKVFILACSG